MAVASVRPGCRSSAPSFASPLSVDPLPPELTPHQTERASARSQSYDRHTVVIEMAALAAPLGLGCSLTRSAGATRAKTSPLAVQLRSASIKSLRPAASTAGRPSSDAGLRVVAGETEQSSA